MAEVHQFGVMQSVTLGRHNRNAVALPMMGVQLMVDVDYVESIGEDSCCVAT